MIQSTSISFQQIAIVVCVVAIFTESRFAKLAGQELDPYLFGTISEETCDTFSSSDYLHIHEPYGPPIGTISVPAHANFQPAMNNGYFVPSYGNNHLNFAIDQHEAEKRFWDQFSKPPSNADSHARTEGYESFGAIIANGYLYGRIEFALMEPHFQNNRGLNISQGALNLIEPFNFGFELTPRYVIGFETNAGPGIEVTHWQFNEFSDGLNFLSNGTTNGTITVQTGVPGLTRSIMAGSAGQLLESRHHMTVNSSKLNFFKAFKGDVARIRGSIGIRYVQVDHELIANRNDGNCLCHNLNFQGGGPNIEIDYFRPIGHTQLNLVGGFAVAAMLGHRDQTIFENGSYTFVETASDNAMAALDVHLGVEWRRKIAKCNSVLIRTTFESQHWFNGGSAVDPDSDFGLHGFVFSAGFTR